jgi:hypothetical protein
MSFGRPRGEIPPDAEMGDVLVESELILHANGFTKYVLARMQDGTKDFAIYTVSGPMAFPNAPKNRHLITRLKPGQLVHFARMFMNADLQARLAELELTETDT